MTGSIGFMLTLAQTLQTFASPNARQVEAALERLSFSKGLAR